VRHDRKRLRPLVPPAVVTVTLPHRAGRPRDHQVRRERGAARHGHGAGGDAVPLTARSSHPTKFVPASVTATVVPVAPLSGVTLVSVGGGGLTVRVPPAGCHPASSRHGIVASGALARSRSWPSATVLLVTVTVFTVTPMPLTAPSRPPRSSCRERHGDRRALHAAARRHARQGRGGGRAQGLAPAGAARRRHVTLSLPSGRSRDDELGRERGCRW